MCILLCLDWEDVTCHQGNQVFTATRGIDFMKTSLSQLYYDSYYFCLFFLPSFLFEVLLNALAVLPPTAAHTRATRLK